MSRSGLYVPARELGYAQSTVGLTATDNTGSGQSFSPPITVTVTVGKRPLLIVGYCGLVMNNTPSRGGAIYITDNTASVVLQSSNSNPGSAGTGGISSLLAIVRVAPPPGPRTYELKGGVGIFASGTASFNGSPTTPIFLHVLEV